MTSTTAGGSSGDPTWQWSVALRKPGTAATVIAVIAAIGALWPAVRALEYVLRVRALDTKAAAPRSSIVSTIVDWSTATLVGATKTTFGVLVKTSAIVLLTFFLLCTGDRLALRLSIGLAVALGFAAFGVADAWTWGLVAGVLHFVPYAGLAVMMGLATIEVYAVRESLLAAGLAMGYVLVIGVLLGTVMAAWLQGRASNVDSAIMFGGTIFFGVIWGGWGLVLGPLLVISTRAILRHANAPPPSEAARATRPPPPDARWHR